ncbi:ghrelin O-acyltransferase isoform X2 [Sorex araneus]|uniref:ghrelin O-acyltransferase isoform X2 n=1 Tax=Sorex araneus TaxID=42254 RepID=UPI002433D824|nr:ghrelin O-acyltransferase isoform X2 [Sorex araneus]
MRLKRLERYLFLLAGGGILAVAALGSLAMLVFIPALVAVILITLLGPREVYRPMFFLQMGWQTVCHLGLHYTEYYLQEPPCSRFCMTLSALMLLTQRATSLSLDIREGSVETAWGSPGSRCSWSARLGVALPYFSYLLCFPSLLGGPLRSFQSFRALVHGSCRGGRLHCFWPLARRSVQILGLQSLRVVLGEAVRALGGLAECRGAQCVLAVWSTAGLFKLTYYSHWLLDEGLLQAAGFAADLDQSPGEEGSDADIWTLETTHRLSLFARTWNHSTARWLRRLIFQRSRAWPLWRTFAFSAWWHGLHPGQVFGFLYWALAVEADYRIHAWAWLCPRSPALRLLHRALAWLHTQLTVAYILLAVEGRSFSSLWLLWNSYGCVFPLMHCILLLLLSKRKHKGN